MTLSEQIVSAFDELLYYIREGFVGSAFGGVGVILFSLLPAALAYIFRVKHRHRILILNLLSTWAIAFLVLLAFALALFGVAGFTFVPIWVVSTWVIALIFVIVAKVKKNVDRRESKSKTKPAESTFDETE